MGPGPSEDGGYFWTVIDDEEVTRPSTINGIRAILPPEDREQFDKEVGETKARDLVGVLVRWAFRDTRRDERIEEGFAWAEARAEANERRLILGEVTVEELHREYAEEERLRSEEFAAERRAVEGGSDEVHGDVHPTGTADP
ncbi:hypothetical protein ACFZBU_08270 [Embleya sp. NPDC008237]|uniref:hypothetical protein n=1 Tax=Embleya sp. NPDC008237 TaxID=3363978 RepID=UPI0036F0D1D0